MTRNLVGQFGLAKIPGRVGWWIRFGQFLLGDDSIWSHAFVVVDDEHVVEAMPGGALLTRLEVYTRRGRGQFLFSDIELTDRQRFDIIMGALALVGTGYSFADYFALALDRWRIRPKWLRKYIAGSGHLICSQLVDLCYQRAGVHLFDDGRDPSAVTPGDLHRCIAEGIPVT